MKRLTEKKYQEQLAKAQERNAEIERGKALKEEKHKYSHRIKLPSTSKLMAVYLFVVLNVTLAYAMIAMWYFADLTYLGVLISDIAAQVLTYFIYAKKATAENTEGGVTYETALQQLRSVDEVTIYKDTTDSSDDDDEAVG